MVHPRGYGARIPEASGWTVDRISRGGPDDPQSKKLYLRRCRERAGDGVTAAAVLLRGEAFRQGADELVLCVGPGCENGDAGVGSHHVSIKCRQLVLRNKSTIGITTE